VRSANSIFSQYIFRSIIFWWAAHNWELGVGDLEGAKYHLLQIAEYDISNAWLWDVLYRIKTEAVGIIPNFGAGDTSITFAHLLQLHHAKPTFYEGETRQKCIMIFADVKFALGFQRCVVSPGYVSMTLRFMTLIRSALSVCKSLSVLSIDDSGSSSFSGASLLISRRQLELASCKLMSCSLSLLGAAFAVSAC
jgi:hypothetical protein